MQRHQPRGNGKSTIAIGWCAVRSVAATFADSERRDRTGVLDVDRAIAQHSAYVECLRRCEIPIHTVGADRGQPDGVFIEDTVVVLDADCGVITRPGAESRRDEVVAVKHSLASHMSLDAIAAPGTVDGGDVLRTAKGLVIGCSTRTNRDGARQLQSFAASRDIAAVIVEVTDCLHLKSACTLANEATLVFDSAVAPDVTAVTDWGLECLAVDEPFGANVLALGRNRVLVSAAAPRTAAMLRQRGMTVIVSDVSEFHRADGALTCLSVRCPTSEGWCT